MGLTNLISHLFDSRLQQIDRFDHEADLIQQSQCNYLISKASRTEYGQKYKFAEIRNYSDFARQIPLITYEELKVYVERMRRGERGLTWPQEIRWFAKSSGTTNDKSKFIPVSGEAMQKCHYRGGKDCVALYLRNNPESRFFSGKGLILGGSHSVNNFSSHSYFGDLSAVLIQNTSPFIELIRTPSRKIALMEHWEEKLVQIANHTQHKDVTNLSGVPSWFLVLIKYMLKECGKTNLLEIWPNLEVFFHGGISFDPYREKYKELIPSDQMHYVETYNASEGFFAVQNDFADSAMLLMIDLGIFFEFIPLRQVNMEEPVALPLWETEIGQIYEMAITTNSGLWRYRTGDTVKITSTSPYKIKITGRTKHFINAFGEELMVANADKGIERASSETGAVVSEYTAAPVFMSDVKKGHHQWLIEFEKEPESVEQFADILDNSLQELNSDYEAKRYKGLALSRLEVVRARPHLFHDWLRDNGKLGGQHKVPRLSNSRKMMDELLLLNGR